jgi:hypothetical protein
MSDIKLSDTKMQETITLAPITITHDIDDLKKRKVENQVTIDQLTQVNADIDKIINRMKDAGCKT